jgi:3-hydroxyacyl-CoA dehydrogenase
MQKVLQSEPPKPTTINSALPPTFDAVVARALANILAGGPLPNATTVSEQYLLDLEREAFLSLCGERKTLERIAHTLKTGKPLRN